MKFLGYVAVAGILGGAVGAARLVAPLAAQGRSAAVAALEKAGAMERVAERTTPHVPKTGTAPNFVVDPGWPKPLPHNWIIGDVGGLFVDRHDHIWVYHRPRALSSTDAGASPDSNG